MERRQFLGTLAATALGSTAAFAAEPLRILVGATPGGGTDLVARALASELKDRLQRVVVVENRPGAGGNIAAAAVARDKDALLLCYTSHAINASLFASLPFDPLKDFTPLSLVARSPLLLVARTEFPANNLKQLRELAVKRNVSIGVAGIGSANHLAGEMLKKQAQVDLVSVPYKGAGPALVDAIGGQIDLVLSNVASVQGLIQGGKLKVLAVTTAQRVPAYPQAAPLGDELPGFDYSSWYGLLASSGMAQPMADQVGAAARAALGGETLRRQLLSEGLQPVGSTSAEFAAYLQAEVERWRKVVVATGAKV